MRLFTNEDLAGTTTPEQNEFLKQSYLDYTAEAHEQWLQYEYHHKMYNLVKFMEATQKAYQYKYLSNAEDTPLFEEVEEQYNKMVTILLEDYNK